MAIHRAVLLIADIGGYTKFMSVHRINLAHAQDVVAQLLESILDASGPFKLAKLEGDAAFMYARVPDGSSELSSMSRYVSAIRASFLERRRQLDMDRFCSCDGCVQASQLNLKFVAHVGEVAEQRVKQHRELAGVAVIAVHRLLKNNVPVPEYVLMTDDVYTHLETDLKQLACGQDEHLEGLGDARTWYVDLNAVETVLPAPPTPSFLRRFFGWVRMTLRSLPYFVGLKKPCDGFRNLGAIGADPKLLPEHQDHEH